MRIRDINFKNKNVFYKWLISYVSVLLVPILISGFIYNEALRIVENQSTMSNKSLLMQIKHGVDNRLKEIDSLSVEIALNNRVKTFITVIDNSIIEQRYKLFNVVADLQIYKSSNNFIKEIFIYYKNSDTVLSTGVPKSSRELFDILKPQSDIDYDKWNEFFFRRYINSFMPIYFSDEKKNNEKTMAYVRSLSMGSFGQPDVVMLILLDETRFLENLQKIPLMEESTVLVIDDKDKIIASTGIDKDTFNFSYSELEEKEGFFSKEIKGSNYNAIYTSSETANLKYLALTSKDVFHNKAKYLSQLILISIILSLLIGGVVTFFYLKKNYNPITRLMQLLKSRTGMADNRNSDEYGLIQETITSVLDEREEINQRLKQQNNVVRSNFLNKLLRGSLDNDIPVNEVLPTFDIIFDSDNFAVILFYIEEFSEYFSENSNMNTKDQFNLLKFMITNVVEELAGQNNYGYMAEINEMMACIVNFKIGNENNSKEELMRVVNQSKDFLMEKCHINLTVAVSNVHSYIEGISLAYEEALEAMEYKLVMGSCEVISYDQIANHNSCNFQNHYSYPLQLEQQMVNYIKSGDALNAKSILEDVLQDNFTSSSNILIAKCIMFDLVSTMVKTIDEISYAYEESLLDRLISLDNLFNSETIKDMKAEMFIILEKVCSYVNSKKKNAHYELKDNVIKIINENYQDVNLSLSKIAEKIGITSSYLSKLFKEQRGEGVLEYISRTRIEKAKELLNQSNNPINEIALKVGYSDINTFIRTFKKYEGLTPGKFRDVK